jgi:putative ABC transport system permease protein
MNGLLRNLRAGLRQIRRQPAFAAAVILTLGLGIAANTAIFSFVDALLIHPFPFRDPDQLVQIRSMRGDTMGMLSMREVLDLRERIPELESIAAHTSSEGGYNYSGDGPPQEWKTILTTGNLFEVLGVPLQLGNKWPDHDDRERDYRVILSHEVWKDTFGSRHDVLGKKITLDHAAGYQIDGVAARTFDYPHGIQIYRSLGGFAQFDQRTYRNVVGIARIRRPYTIQNLQARLDAVGHMLSVEYPQTNSALSFRAVSFRELYSGDVKPYLIVLQGAVGFVLLIACANVVNLQLSRTLGRSREMSVRVALGASRSVLMAQLLTESAILSFAAALLGIPLAFWWVKILRDTIGVGLPSWMTIGVDGGVLLFTAGISLISALISGVVPALILSRRSVINGLKEGGRGASGGKLTLRLRNGVVVLEIAVAVILLAGAGLLIRSFLELQNRDKGFQSNSISTFRVALGWKRYIDQASISRYYARAIQELSRVPGFEGIGLSTTPPLLKQDVSEPHTVQAEGQSVQEALENPYVNSQNVSENYFRLLGIPLLSGRYFSESDNTNSEPVVIVSALLSKRLWGDKDPVGRRIRYDPSTATPGTFRRVIGVVGDIRNGELNGEPELDFYVPYRQEADGNQYIMARTRLSLSEFRTMAERALYSIDPEQSIFDFATYDERIQETVWQVRLSRTLLVLFSGVALLLAAIGIYGVMSYLVGQRQREMGIRIALGASPGSIQTLVLTHAAMVGACGLVIGIIGAVVLGRILKHVLHDVNGADPLAFIAAPALLFAITLAASALPAWRASRVDPSIALRAE